MLCCAFFMLCCGQWAVQGFVLPNKCSNKVAALIMKNIWELINWSKSGYGDNVPHIVHFLVLS